MKLDCDFHIHGRYSIGTSKNMTLEVISKQASLKGLDLIGTGDALHNSWLKEIKSLNTYSDGVYERNKCKFIITLEIEDMNRVHHLIFLPSIESGLGLKESFSKYSTDINKNGRPHIKLNGEAIVDYVTEVGGIVGPSHAFVPWTSIYKEFNTIRDCYGDHYKHIPFIELGLSADTEMADYIPELQKLTFLSNSDAHSPWPHRMGREFNRINIANLSFDNIVKAIKNHKVELNVGLDPRLGKYHRTACVRCYLPYNLEDAESAKWRCSKCNGLIKKGVKDRIANLNSFPISKHPVHRPKYIRIAPLAEILCLTLGVKSIYSVKVQKTWKLLIERFGNEISILIDEEVENIMNAVDEKTGKMIEALREDDFKIIPGGGGKYGELVFETQDKNLK